MFNVAVVGATGAVGSMMLRVLEERGFPVSELHPLASARSEGRTVEYLGKPFTVRTLTAGQLRGRRHRAVLGRAAQRSREFAPAAVEAGAVVIDNSSAFRMAPNVPLVVPEVNEAAIQATRGSSPTRTAWPRRWSWCSSRSPTRSASSASSSPATRRSRAPAPAAIAELRRADRGATWPATSREPQVYPHPIAFNVLPHIDTFDETGYTGEERKVIAETQKMLGLPDLPVSATCVRVPVFNGHSVSIQIETTEPLDADAARGLLMGAPGLILARRARAGDLPAAAARLRARRGHGRPDPQRSLAPARTGAVALERQPAQGRGHQRRADRRIAGDARLAVGPSRVAGH